MQPFIHNKLRIAISLALFTVLTFLVVQRHQYTGCFNWRSTMWGDAVGYYIYSPALFIYGFDATKLPENIVEKTGEGFIISEDDKIITRYSCGVAILQSPVFLAVHLYAKITDKDSDGFSGIYHSVTNFAAIVYSFLGLIFLWFFLRNYFNRKITFFSILSVFLGTNLLYYTIDATGMSHVYSFFLFALLLWLSKLFFSEIQQRKKNWIFLFIALTSALIVLIRPTNIAFIGLVFLLDIHSFKEIKTRMKEVLTPRRLGVLLLSFLLVFLPQMLYWKYSSGSFITNSYEEYGFTNWASPNVIKFLFSTNNGLFTYNPFYIVILISIVFMIWKKQKFGIFILIWFIAFIYILSSWFVFSFGCGFGSRNFVEYATLFTIPIGFLYSNLSKQTLTNWLLVSFIIISVFVNIKLTSSYNKCFEGGDWNWKEYKHLLKATKYNRTLFLIPPLSMDKEEEFTKPIRIKIYKISAANFRRAIVNVKTRIYEKDCEASIVFQISTPDTLLYWNGVAIAEQFSENEIGKYKVVQAIFGSLRNIPQNRKFQLLYGILGKIL